MSIDPFRTTVQAALALLLAVAPATFAADSPAQVPSARGPAYKVVTASERGTYIVLGRDLAKYVAPAAGIDLTALPSAGSAENIYRLRHEEGVKFALVQSDVYQAFLDQAAAGHREAGDLIRPLRVVAPLYNEEIYFIARADAPLEYVHDVQRARINAGPRGSGTALTTVTLYQAMYHAPIPDAQVSFLSNEDALVKLLNDQSLDVVVVVGGQPMKLLADMKPEARQLIKLLKFDPSRAESRDALKTYFNATVRASSYPNLLDADVPGLAVKAFLVTYDYNLGQTVQALRRFARSLCTNFSTLQAEGHPKWRDVDLALPDLGEGWSYYAPTAQELRRCAATSTRASSSAPARASCAQVEGVLGLCDRPAVTAPRERPSRRAAAAPGR